MAYPFKPVEHCIYKNTFLKDVRVAVAFPMIDDKSASIELLQAFFDKFTGATINATDFFVKKNILIYSNNHEIEYRFSLNYAEAKVSTPLYSSFESANSYWHLLMDYMKALNVSQIDKLIVRKYSKFTFKSDNSDLKIKDVMNVVFSDELMNKISQSTSFKDLNSFEKAWSEPSDDGGSTFEVIFGFKKADTTIKDDHLTLVTSVQMNNGPIGLKEFMGRIEEYNIVLFRAFHWCVKEEIINSMK